MIGMPENKSFPGNKMHNPKQNSISMKPPIDKKKNRMQYNRTNSKNSLDGSISGIKGIAMKVKSKNADLDYKYHRK